MGGRSNPRSRERVARNFVRTHGRTRFQLLISGLRENKSGAVLGRELGVSRERVRQWKNTFGETITHYKVYPEVQRLLDGR